MCADEMINTAQYKKNKNQLRKYKNDITLLIYLHIFIPLIFIAFFSYVASKCGNINTFLGDPDIVLIGDLIFISSSIYYRRLTRDSKNLSEIVFKILITFVILYSLYYSIIKLDEICPGRGLEADYFLCILSLGISIVVATGVVFAYYYKLKNLVQGNNHIVM